MPEPNRPQVTQVPISADALRIVLFGLPHAGKSSLLGALAQAGQTQENLLPGHLTDLTHGLTELQQRVYEGKPLEAPAEVVPYPVTFTPGAGGEERQVVLLDCDGRVANDLLVQRDALEADSDKHPLLKAILEADALILPVDPSASPWQVDADFAEFVRFLRRYQQNRGQRSEVGGLPVFLVLTKCDLLTQPTDSPATWIERIEERKRQVGQRFRDFLEEDEEDEKPLPFGSIDLHLWATAIKHPELPGAPTKPREPFGVAELFRQAVDYAAAYRQRSQRSTQRLVGTVLGSLAMVAGMAALAATFLTTRPEDRPQELLTKVDIVRSREGQTPSARLREPLQPKISELTELKDDPKFAALPAETRDYITSRLQELRAYRTYKERVLQVRSPALARNERDLEEIETSLNDLAPPAEYRSEWGQTEAALLRAQRLEDIKILRAAVTEMEDWYRRLTRRGEELWTFSDQKPGVADTTTLSSSAPLPWPAWHQQVASLVDQAEIPPHRPTERVPGSSTVTYATALRFDRVTEARTSWQNVKLRLQRLRDLSAALGLVGTVVGRPPLLDILAPPGFSADQARGRLQELEKAYPHFRQDFTLAELPDAVLGEVRRAARNSYDHALEVGREVVARHLLDASPDGRETPQSWQRLRSWLTAPDELQAWRVLATVLARLQNPDASDPVSALELFVRQDHFDLELRHLTLELPDELKLRPAGRLSIQHRSGDENKPTLVYEVSAEGQHDVRRRVTHYVLRPVAGSSLTYRPGDLLWADLPVKDGDNQEWLLTWARSRSQVYQFERLAQPPRLHRRSQENTEGKAAEGVSLAVLPERGLPAVPDLVPVLKATKP